MQFRILGPIEAVLDSGPAALGAPKQRGLLALLLVNRRRVVTAEQLIDGLWGEDPPASALQSLQVYVHGLRRALGAERIETAGRGYRVVVEEDELDLDRFERTLERGRAALEAGRADDAARRPPGGARSLARVGARRPAGGDAARRRGREARRAAARRRSSFASTRSSPAADTTPSSPSSRRSRPSSRTASASSSSGCSRSTAAAARRRRSRSTASAREASRRISASTRAQPCRSWSARSCGRTRASRLPKRLPARRGRCRCPRRRSSAAGSSSRRSARSSATRARGSSRSPAREGRARRGSGSRSPTRARARAPRRRAVRRPRAGLETRSCSCRRSRRRSRCAKAGGTLAESVTEHLRERRLLLVLDNFEQLLPAAPFVGDLLAAAPRLWILATSRAPLRLAAEREYPVPPFDAPDADLPFEALVKTDAVRLFAARAQAVDPDFELDDDQRTGGRPRLQRGSTGCRSQSSSPRRAPSCSRRPRFSSGSNASRTCCRPARATRPPASRRSPPRSSGATTCSARTSARPFARLGVFVRRLHAGSRRARMRRDAREPRHAGRQQPAAATRRPLHDARDGSPLRRRAARGGRGRGSAPPARGVADASSPRPWRSERSRART